MLDFLFHRDLRLFDNVGFINACEQCEVVFPLFILDPKQSDPTQNKYFNPVFKDALLLALQGLENSIHQVLELKKLILLKF